MKPTPTTLKVKDLAATMKLIEESLRSALDGYLGVVLTRDVRKDIERKAVATLVRDTPTTLRWDDSKSDPISDIKSAIESIKNDERYRHASPWVPDTPALDPSIDLLRATMSLDDTLNKDPADVQGFAGTAAERIIQGDPVYVDPYGYVWQARYGKRAHGVAAHDAERDQTVKITPGVDVGIVNCDCGAEKAKTTHALWCSTQEAD